MSGKPNEKVTAENFGRKLHEILDAWRKLLAYRDLIDKQSSKLAEHCRLYVAANDRTFGTMPSNAKLGKARELTATLAVTTKNFAKEIEDMHTLLSNCEDFFTE